MIIFRMALGFGEAESAGNLQLHLRPVFRVPAPALGLPVGGHGKCLVPAQFFQVLGDAVFIAIFRSFEFSPHLVSEAEGDPLVHHGLAADHILVILRRDVDVGKNLRVRPPFEAGAGFLPVGGFLFQTAHVAALFKMQAVLEAVPADHRVEIFRSVLGGAGAQAVEAQRILIIFAVFTIFAAGVQLAEHQLPVVALFFFVPVHRTAPAEVLDLHGQVLVTGDDHRVAMALPGLIDGVGQNFKDRVLAAFQIIGAKNNGRALTHPFLPLQGNNGFVAVGNGFLLRHKILTHLAVTGIGVSLHLYRKL